LESGPSGFCRQVCESFIESEDRPEKKFISPGPDRSLCQGPGDAYSKVKGLWSKAECGAFEPPGEMTINDISELPVANSGTFRGRQKESRNSKYLNA
jgi:hypothetical protein